MRRNLAWLSVFVVAAMLAVSAWASTRMGIVEALRSLLGDPAHGSNPWFVATLFDTYFAFMWFWLWVAYRETSNAARVLWLVLIAGLGNFAMAAYVLLQLRRLPPDATVEHLLRRA